MERSDRGWRPIKTLPDYLDTAIVLWNPCDGIHLPDMTATPMEREFYRESGVYTHWRQLNAPSS